MEFGIDSFAANNKGKRSNAVAMSQLLDRIKQADECELDVFGIGEHHREEFLDSSPSVILAAAAALTKRIRLTSAVTVLSAADPVRVYQDFATLDLISKGRAEIVVGRGSFTEAFPLFGLNLKDYDDLFSEKLELLLTIRDYDIVNWTGKFRPSLINQTIYPRPIQKQIPIWIGIGGTPESAIRAGTLGLPLMIAIIGGETKRFRRLVDLYKDSGKKAGHPPERLKVGMHALGYVAKNTQQAQDDFFPGYADVFTRIGQERGWSPVSRNYFDRQVAPEGALLVGDPEDVAEKILLHSNALGGLSRLTFQMNVAALPHDKLMKSIELIGKKVMPLVNRPE